MKTYFLQAILKTELENQFLMIVNDFPYYDVSD